MFSKGDQYAPTLLSLFLATLSSSETRWTKHFLTVSGQRMRPCWPNKDLDVVVFSHEARSFLYLNYSSMLNHGVWAEIKVGEEHLRLFAEHNALGVQASVYNVIAKTWVAPSEAVDDLEQAKERAAAHAQQYLQRVGNLKLPPLRWKESRSA
jgi:hypothetical protein